MTGWPSGPISFKICVLTGGFAVAHDAPPHDNRNRNVPV